MQLVVDDCLTVQRHGKAYRRCEAGSIIYRALLVAQIAAAAVITRGQFICHLLIAHLLKPSWRAIATVSMARCDQLMSILLIKRFALRLIIRPVRPANQGALIDIHTEPFHAID